MKKIQLFEDIINENALIDYFKLYNDLTTEIGIFYDKLFGLKAALRLTEANKSSIKSLEDMYAEIDVSINRIRELLSEMRQQEGRLLFAAEHVSPDLPLENHIQFANSYVARKAEALRNSMNSDKKLIQIKTDIIDQMTKVEKRNQVMRNWNSYKMDINEFNTELSHVDNKVKEYAEKVDSKFNTSLIQIIYPI
jgi:hypothetical protein